MNKKSTLLSNQIQTKFIQNGWITLYDDLVYSGLVQEHCAPSILERCDWEIYIGDKGFDIYGDGRYVSGTDRDVTPFVYRRFEPDEVVVIEEFRMLYNLRKEKINESVSFYGIDENGDKIDVIRQDGLTICVRLPYLKEFLAYKKRHLVLYFDNRVALDNGYNVDYWGTLNTVVEHGTDYVYEKSTLQCGNSGSCEWFMGKCLLRYNVSDIKSLWEWEDGGYADFVIGYTEKGEEKLHSCNKETLSNYFVKNDDEPLETTLVFFRKEVLEKYYSNPNKYSVKDGLVECLRYWSIRVDNDRYDYVVVTLVDLGHLPHKEQLYWKTFNVAPPINDQLSHTANKRWMDGQFCDVSMALDLLFKQEFERFNNAWKNKFGWNLFLPLVKDDEHRYSSLHSLTTENNTAVFEEQVLSITKITIDSLNESKLVEGLTKKEKEGLKGGISKLDNWLQRQGIHIPEELEFLRNLQELRSGSVAHRKSSNTERMKFRDYFYMNSRSERVILDDIFRHTIAFLNVLNKSFIEPK